MTRSESHLEVCWVIAVGALGSIAWTLYAGIHSFAVLAAWYLSKQLFPEQTRRGPALRSAGTILAMANPLVYWARARGLTPERIRSS